MTADGCSGVSVPPGGACVVDVRYLANSAGVAVAGLQLRSNALGAPHVVGLRGEAVSPSTISGFSPPFGVPGTAVTISGSALTSTSAVAFNGVSASYTVNDDTSVTAVVPPGATPGPITVSTVLNDTTSTTPFQVTPRIDNVSTSAGPTGTSVTLTGAHFLATDNTVRFGAGYIRGVSSPYGVTLQFTVPDGLDLCAPGAAQPCPTAFPRVVPGSYDVSVMSGSAISNVVPFTVTP